jgi:VIT1/CCC1 family predicted Fe2+/Mn2+ transporter
LLLPGLPRLLRVRWLWACGYLAAKGDAEHYASERQRETLEVKEKPDVEMQEVADVFQSYGLSSDESKPIIDALRSRPQAWIDFMMRFELGLEKPDPRRARTSALTIGGAYIAGGFIPLLPYILISTASTAFNYSVIFTLCALAVFGYIKGHFTGTSQVRSAFQTVLIGGLAAAVAFVIARFIA